MNTANKNEFRDAARAQRRPPVRLPEWFVPFEGEGIIQGDLPCGSGVLILEATNADGETAPWFQDYWWTELVERLGTVSLTIHVAPTPSAVLHPEVRHQVEMVRRVVPTWRLIGHAYRTDISGEEDIRTLAMSGFDELRVIDDARPNWSPGRMREDLPTAQILAAIRQEQQQLGTNRPVLVRAPATSADQFRPKPTTATSAPAESGSTAPKAISDRVPSADRAADAPPVIVQAVNPTTGEPTVR